MIDEQMDDQIRFFVNPRHVNHYYTVGDCMDRGYKDELMISMGRNRPWIDEYEDRLFGKDWRTRA